MITSPIQEQRAVVRSAGWLADRLRRLMKWTKRRGASTPLHRRVGCSAPCRMSLCYQGFWCYLKHTPYLSKVQRKRLFYLDRVI